MRKLVVISHTEHQKNQEGEIFGWGPTINELNQMSNHWHQIVHIACLENKYPSGSSIQYVANKIKFVPIPIFGGKYLWNKLDIFFKIPNIIYKIRKEVKNASHVQLRLPMGIGIFLLIYFWFRKKKQLCVLGKICK